MKAFQNRPVADDRQGVIAPIVAVSLLVVLAGIALVLDRLWLDMAQVEMQVATESAALAAARHLAGDHLIKSNADTQRPLALAREATVLTAAQNLVAGVPLQIDVTEGADLRFGVLVNDDSPALTQFLETEINPTTVVVTGRRTRSQNNPVSLFLQNLTQQPGGDVVFQSEATVDNRVVGIRPLEGTAAPAIPLGILARDASGTRKDTWQNQIEERNGPDQYGIDPTTGEVVAEPDGIPEILLHSAAAKSDPSTANIMLLDLGSGPGTQSQNDQILNGLLPTDLVNQGGALLLNAGPLTFTGRATLNSGDGSALTHILGQCRVCMLYENQPASSQGGQGNQKRVQCVGLVAGRVLNVTSGNEDTQKIVFQPGVIATRTAVLAAELAPTSGIAAPRNKYLYKLTLTQ